MRSTLPLLDRFGSTDYKLRLIYFVPQDREPAPDYEAKIRVIMSIAADIVSRDLRSAGFKTDGLAFEQKHGSPVHLIRGDKPASFYNNAPKYGMQQQWRRVSDAIKLTHGDPRRHVMVAFAETYEETPAREAWNGHVAFGGVLAPDGGLAVYSSWFMKDDFSRTKVKEQIPLFFDTTPITGRKQENELTAI